MVKLIRGGHERVATPFFIGGIAASVSPSRGGMVCARMSPRTRAVRVDAQLTDEPFSVVEHRRGVRPCVRVDPDHEHDVSLLQGDHRGDATAGTPDEG